jgi:Tol biopolymer transport system component
MSSSGRVKGIARRLTTDTGADWEASCAANTIAFTSSHVVRDIWSTPFDFDRGVPTGQLSRLSEGPVNRAMPSLSANGLVAFMDNFGLANIWTRELDNGKESILARSSIVQRYPVSSPSGRRIAFSVYERDKRLVYISTPGASPEILCEGCLRATDWSRDEKKVLIFGGNPYQIRVLDIESRSQKVLVRHPQFHVLYGRFSPDNRWISFTARVQPDRGRIFIARCDSNAPVPESGWIPIADVAPDDYANWSPDGGALYYTSARDGYSCLWAVQIDAESRRPSGEPFAVQHFHGLLTFSHGGWSIGSGRIALTLRKTSGNVWTMAR